MEENNIDEIASDFLELEYHMHKNVKLWLNHAGTAQYCSSYRGKARENDAEIC